MKMITFAAVILASSVAPLHSQIRSDFVLVSDGEIPHVILDKEGRLHATWRGRGIHYGLFDSLGNPLQATKTISESGLTTFSRLAVSTDHIVVFWQSIIPGQVTRVAGLLFSPDSGNVIGSFGSTGNISAGSPDVVFLNDSTILAVWPGDGPLTPYPSTGIYGQVFTSALETKGNSQLISADVLEQSKHSYARVATNERSESAIVVWVAEGPNFGANVFGRLLTKNGTPQDSTFLVGKDLFFSTAWSSNVAMAVDGSFVVVWSAENMNGVWSVYQRRFDREGRPLSSVERINETGNTKFSEVAVAMDVQDDFVVAWEGERENNYKIIAQRFLSDGTQLGGNFQISIASDSFLQGYPSVALYNDKIYTAWHSVEDSLSEKINIRANILDFNNPIVDVKSMPSEHPRLFHLYQNYPNPFNPSSIIKYEISRRLHVRLIIYNMLGEEMIILMDREQTPGGYEIQWDGKDANGDDISSGVYVYRLSVGGYTEARKMLLIK